MARRADRADIAENRRWLKTKYSRISGENCSFAVLLYVTIRATDETAARH